MSKFIRGLLWTLGVLLVVALGLRALVFDVWTVPDDPPLAASIAPTLAAGDVLLVLKRGAPGFGELVRCPDPDTPGGFVVGRIAGVGGDVVETDGTLLSVNDTRYDAESVCPEPKHTIKHPRTGLDVTIGCDVVVMGGGRHFRGNSPKGPLERKLRHEVRPDTVFLLSDNRNFHDDSRDYGLQPRDLCKQRIVFRLWGKGGWSDDEHRMTFVR
ncbi:MAG: signal peptidase I [Polyangiaceae bacterium]|nr:signal peptidase I [Polyangiaceae bacterium]